ncbi:nitroreductase family protein [Moorellaceae bacterium AZ2]
MEVWEAITQRRSIRNFLPEPVEEAILLKLVEAGRWAPSGSNIQPWHFIIVRDKARIKKIEAFAPGMFGNPAAVVAICTDLELAEKKGGRLGREIMSLIDAGIAAQNIALAAVDMGLGTCIIRSFNPQAVQEILQLPPAIVPQLLVSVGYPEKIPPAPRRKELEEIVSWEEYGKKVSS